MWRNGIETTLGDDKNGRNVLIKRLSVDEFGIEREDSIIFE